MYSVIHFNTGNIIKTRNFCTKYIPLPGPIMGSDGRKCINYSVFKRNVLLNLHNEHQDTCRGSLILHTGVHHKSCVYNCIPLPTYIYLEMKPT